MNAGKACAQATHAANQCVYEITHGSSKDDKEALKEWEAETGHGFGTCIVLEAHPSAMHDAVKLAQQLGVPAGITHDPSYPLRDGDALHLIPLDTCAFIFCEKDDLKPVLSLYSLYP